jgi:ATP-dependent RNA/DNA helicase IGHMBP2
MLDIPVALIVIMVQREEGRSSALASRSANTVDAQIREFVTVQRALLTAELASESGIEESAATKSTSAKNDKASHSTAVQVPGVLRNLALHHVSVGLYGRTVVTLGRKDHHSGVNEGLLLPHHCFTTGDEVQILPKPATVDGTGTSAKNGEGGVVSQVDETSISIALFGKNHTHGAQTNSNSTTDEESTIVGSPPFSIVPKSSAEVHNKMIQALADLQRGGESHPICGNVVKAIFSDQQSARYTTIQPPDNVVQPNPYNPDLDDSQLEAIAFSLHANRHLSLIHGPPGTGKTSTVAELIQQAVHHHKYKVLVAAPSNVAVDNVLERIVESQGKQKHRRSTNSNKTTSSPRIRAVRIGHPARIKPAILQYSLEAQVQSAEGTEIVQAVRQELQSFLQILLKPKSSLSSRGTDSRSTAYREVKLLRKEVRERETKVVQSLLRDAQVVLCTNVGAANRILKDMEFDLVIIDEAAQALEASCWIPILKGRRLVLAGDHCQLPPTIKCNDPMVQKGLAITLFERILKSYKETTDQVSRMLQVQYRMHQSIADWASRAMYHGELRTHKSVAQHVLSDLATYHHHDGEDHPQPALLLIDTAGCGMEEGETSAGSRFNEGEAQLVVQHVQTLLRAGVKPEDIAVISPYNGQVELLRTLILPEIAPKLEIRSVDGFQGGEREAVILSLVRCNNKGVIGFLGDSRRLNVAITRAKRQCAVICDTETVTNNKFIGGLIDWMETHGEYRSAMEYNQSDVQGDLELAEVELKKLMMESRPRSDPTISKPTNQEHFANKEKERLTSLLHQITEFAREGSPGKTKNMGSGLSKNDRRLVHERATELGIEHRSEGVEGVDRHVILEIPGGTSLVCDAFLEELEQNANEVVLDVQDEECDNDEVETLGKQSAFQELVGDDDEDDDADEQVKPTTTHDDSPGMNNLLASLALERQQRQRDANPSINDLMGQQAPSRNGKKKKKGGQKLGGLRAPVKPADNWSHDLDDMAFLDSQIEQVQQSHGRKVEGAGAYRTIINGILISKPAPQIIKKDNKKSAALNAKLQAAQEDRKAKTKKKK